MNKQDLMFLMMAFAGQADAIEQQMAAFRDQLGEARWKIDAKTWREYDAVCSGFNELNLCLETMGRAKKRFMKLLPQEGAA